MKKCRRELLLPEGIYIYNICWTQSTRDTKNLKEASWPGGGGWVIPYLTFVRHGRPESYYRRRVELTFGCRVLSLPVFCCCLLSSGGRFASVCYEKHAALSGGKKSSTIFFFRYCSVHTTVLRRTYLVHLTWYIQVGTRNSWRQLYY